MTQAPNADHHVRVCDLRVRDTFCLGATPRTAVTLGLSRKDRATECEERTHLWLGSAPGVSLHGPVRAKLKERGRDLHLAFPNGKGVNTLATLYHTALRLSCPHEHTAGSRDFHRGDTEGGMSDEVFGGLGSSGPLSSPIRYTDTCFSDDVLDRDGET